MNNDLNITVAGTGYYEANNSWGAGSEKSVEE